MNDINETLAKNQDAIDDLNNERATFQNNLTSLKRTLADGILPDYHYKRIIEAKYEYSSSITKNIEKLRIAKKERVELLKQKEELYLDTLPDSLQIIKDNLHLLKDKYFEFYKDKTRISYMRKMAHDFIIDIDKVIKSIQC